MSDIKFFFQFMVPSRLKIFKSKTDNRWRIQSRLAKNNRFGASSTDRLLTSLVVLVTVVLLVQSRRCLTISRTLQTLTLRETFDILR